MKNNNGLLGSRRNNRIAKAPGSVNTTSGLADLSGATLSPPVLGEVIGANDNILGNKLMTGAAVGGDDHRTSIDKIIKVLRFHTVAVHLIEEAYSMRIVVVTPKPSRLMRKNIITSLTLIKGEKRTKAASSLRLTAARGADEEDSNRLRIIRTRLSLNTAILSGGLMVTHHGRKVIIPKLLAGTLLVKGRLKSNKIRTGALLTRITKLDTRVRDGRVVLLSTILNSLPLGTAAGLEMQGVALSLKAIKHRELEAAADGLRVLQLEVTLEVVGTLGADLLLADEVLDAAGEVRFAEREGGELGVVEREHVGARAGHERSLKKKREGVKRPSGAWRRRQGPGGAGAGPGGRSRDPTGSNKKCTEVSAQK
jgi:hypothetical protein